MDIITSLTAYSGISTDVIVAMRKSYPLDLLRNVVKVFLLEEKTNLTSNGVIDDVLAFQTPYFIMSVVPLILMIALPIAGIKHFYFSKDNALSEIDVAETKKNRRFIYASGVLIAATLVMISGVVIFIAGVQLTQGFDFYIATTNSGFDQFQTHLQKSDDVIQSLKQIHLNLNTSGGENQEGGIDFITNRIMMSVNDDISYFVDPLLFQYETLNNDTTETAGMLQEVSDHVKEMYNFLGSGKIVEEKLKTVRSSVSVLVQKSCSISCHNLDAIDISLKYNVQDPSISDFDSFQLKLVPILNLVITIDKTKAMAEFAKIYQDIEDEVATVLRQSNETKKGVKAKKEFFSLLEQKLKDLSWLSKYSNEHTSNMDKNSLIQHMKVAFLILFKLLSLIVLILCVLLFAGLGLGQIGASHVNVCGIGETSNAIRMARTGGDLLKSAIILFVIVSFLLQVVFLAFIPIGANMKHACTLVESGDIMKIFSGTGDEMDANDDDVQTSFHQNHRLQKCKDGFLLWNAFEFDRTTTHVAGVQSDPTSEIIIEKLNFTFTNPLPRVSFREFNISNLQERLKTILLLAEQPALNFDIHDLMALTEKIKSTHPGNSDIINAVNNVQGSLIKFINDCWVASKTEQELFTQEAKGLDKQLQKLSFSVEEFNYRYDKVNDLFPTLSNRVDEILEEELRHELERSVFRLSDDIALKIGECDWLANIFDNLEELLCTYMSESTNSIWLSLATTTFVFVVFYPLLVGLRKHYRIVALDFECEDEIEYEEIQELMPSSSHSDQHFSSDIVEIGIRESGFSFAAT